MNPSIRESDYIKTWAAFAVCATIGGFIAGFFAGLVVGVILKAVGSSPEAMRLWGSVAGFFAGLPVSYAFFRFFVSRMLIARFDKQEPPPPEKA